MSTSREVIEGLLREDLRGRSAYGAPQMDVPVALNTNENSYPLPPAVISALSTTSARIASGLNRYPDREFTALREALAGYLLRDGVNLRIEQIWAGNGSNEVLLHLAQAFGGTGRCALGFTPGYAMHTIITATTGTTWIDGARGPTDGSAATGPEQFDLSAESAVRQINQYQPDLVFVASPNNPTGTAIDLETIAAIYDAAPGIVVIDEAYHEFARAGTPSALTLLEGRERLAVSRTMSKAFGFAGGRLGYLAADPALIDALRLVRLPYHLSTQTQAFAIALLEHADLMLGTVDAIREQRDRIVTELTSMGLQPVPSDANFVLFGGLADAPATFNAMIEDGVLVRDVGIPGHLRVTAGAFGETTAFLMSLLRHYRGPVPTG